MQAVAEQKPSYNELVRWVGVISDRLTNVAHVYHNPPYADAYIREQDRQARAEVVLNVIRRLNSLIESNDSLTVRSPAELMEKDEEVIAQLFPLFRELLVLLPHISDDMQFLLKSPWYENCTGRKATDIFCGPTKDLNEGIGSGRVEHGRLPEILSNLIEREQLGDGRPPHVIEPESDYQIRRAALAGRRRGSFGSAGRMD